VLWFDHVQQWSYPFEHAFQSNPGWIAVGSSPFAQAWLSFARHQIDAVYNYCFYVMRNVSYKQMQITKGRSFLSDLP
jgi:hypothetical protein